MTRRLAVEGARPAARPNEIAEAPRLDGEGRRLLECRPRRREDAPERHVGEQAEDDEREQRAQIAAAGAGQVSAGAAAGEHHAEAEHQAAQDVARPVEPGTGEIHRLVQRHDAARLQQLGPDEGGRGGQDPGAEAAPVAKVVNIAERAHGAEIAGEHHGAEQAADRQPSQRQPDAAVLANPIAQRFDHRGSSPTAILSHKRQAICSTACRLPGRTFKGLGVAWAAR